MLFGRRQSDNRTTSSLNGVNWTMPLLPPSTPVANGEKVLEEAARVAEDERNIRMVGGSTGDAHGTARMIAAAIRALITPTEGEKSDVHKLLAGTHCIQRHRVPRS